MKEKKKIRTKDGRTIGITCYLPETGNKGCIVLAPAAQFVQRNYEAFSNFFEQQGYIVITFDYRGVGESAPAQLKGFEAGLQQWAVHDADAVLRFARSNFQNQELIYIGHGIGGELVGLAQASQYINRLVLVSSSLSCKKLWTWTGRLRLNVRKTVARLASRWVGYFPGKRLGLFNDLPKGVAHEWANWCDNPNGLFDVFPENNYRKLQVPLLAVSFSNDWTTPEKAVKRLLSYFSSACITWHHINPQELGWKKRKQCCFFAFAMQSKTWEMLRTWLNEEPCREQTLIIND
ncbi:MAG: alpha/beta fold hydrolase [Chitinophagaceae bacterium]